MKKKVAWLERKFGENNVAFAIAVTRSIPEAEAFLAQGGNCAEA